MGRKPEKARQYRRTRYIKEFELLKGQYNGSSHRSDTDVVTSTEACREVLRMFRVDAELPKALKDQASAITERWGLVGEAAKASTFWNNHSATAEALAFYKRHTNGLPTLSYCAVRGFTGRGNELVGNPFEPLHQQAARMVAGKLLTIMDGDQEALTILDGELPRGIVQITYKEDRWGDRYPVQDSAQVRLSDYSQQSLAAHNMINLSHGN